MSRGSEQTLFQRRHAVGQQVNEMVLSTTNHQGNASHDTMTYHLTPIRMFIIKKTKITSFGEDVEKMEVLYSVDGNVNWYCYQYYRKQYGGSLKN